jgi:hypothetical protein
MRKCRDPEIRQILGFVSAGTIRFLTSENGPTSADSIISQLKEYDVTSCANGTPELQAVSSSFRHL